MYKTDCDMYTLLFLDCDMYTLKKVTDGLDSNLDPWYFYQAVCSKVNTPQNIRKEGKDTTYIK